METLQALGEIFRAAIPTFILLWILYLYSSKVFFRPLDKTLRKREESTVGLRRDAETKIAQAEQRTAEYQDALRAAWSEVYRQQEQERQKALEQRAAVVQQARQQAEEMIRRAQEEIRQEAGEAKKLLAAEAEQMAAAIAGAILSPARISRSAPRGPEAAS